MSSKQKTPYTTFSLYLHVYDYSIYFCISKDFDKVIKFVNWKFELPTDDLAPRKIEDLVNCNGKVFHRPGYVPILWMPAKPITSDELGVLSHEIFHIVCLVMRWAYIPLTQDSEEAYSHLIKYITKESLKKLDKINGRKKTNIPKTIKAIRDKAKNVKL